MELLARSGVGRDINRHHYTREEIDRDLARPVVRALLDLIHLRNTHPAFGGIFEVGGHGSSIVLTWTHEGASAVLEADLEARTARITATTDAARGVVTCEELLTSTDVLR